MSPVHCDETTPFVNSTVNTFFKVYFTDFKSHNRVYRICGRQFLTSKVDPRTERVKNLGIQIRWKELSKTFVMISNWKIL